MFDPAPIVMTDGQFVAEQFKLEKYKDLALGDQDIADIIELARDTTKHDLQQQIATIKNYKKHAIDIARGTIALALQEWQAHKNKERQA